MDTSIAVGLSVAWLLLAIFGLVISGAKLKDPRFPRLSGLSFGGLALLLAASALVPILLPSPPDGLNSGLRIGQLILTFCFAGFALFEFFLSSDGQARRSFIGVNPEQDRLRFAIDATSNGLWEWNIKKDTVWFSTTFKELLGFKEDEFPDSFSAWEERLHKDDHAETIKDLERHLKENTDFDVSYRLRRKDGGYHWFRARGRAERNAQGHPIRMAGSIQDIDQQQEDRQRLSQNEELFRAVFERAKVGIALTDEEGHLSAVNPALCKMLQYDEEGLQTRTLKSITHPEDLIEKKDAENVTDQVPSSSAYKEYERRYLRKDGEVLYAITGVSRLGNSHEGNGLQTLVHVQDVTRLKTAERKAIESSQFKSQFLAHMSHEIRTPLGGLLGMIELALGTELTDEQEHFLVTAKRSSEQLMFLINDILDLSKIEAGKLEIMPSQFTLRKRATAMISTLSLKAHEKGLELAFHVEDDVPEDLSADWSRIQQVLTNLVGNAIKFTKKGQVVLEIQLDRRARKKGSQDKDRETSITFSVSDTGIGIPSDKYRKIFEAFHHADSSIPRKFGGTGLGLAISQQLVELMGGRINVESEVGVGSRFSFAIPVTVAGASVTQGAQVTTDRHYGNLRALIIDDNATSLEFLSRTLTERGIRPTGFTSVEAAESFLKQQIASDERFDFCFLDSRIEGNEDFAFVPEVAPYLKQAQRTVLLLSSPNRQLELQRCRDATIKTYLTKPVTARDLVELLDNLTETTAPTSTRPAALRILLVEDNPINSEVALNFVRQLGHEASHAENGQEAVDILERESFDVVLMDLQMPKLSGLDATRKIREREGNSSAHQWIIALTAQAMKGDREECLAAGMDDYISKPIKRAELKAAIQKAPVGEAPTPSPSLPANADPSAIIDAFEGETNVAKKVGQLFLETSPPLWENLQQSIRQGDAKTLQTTAHRLKGSFMQFGAEEAEGLALSLEQAGRAGQTENLEDTVSALRNSMRDLKKQIYQLLRH